MGGNIAEAEEASPATMVKGLYSMHKLLHTHFLLLSI